MFEFSYNWKEYFSVIILIQKFAYFSLFEIGFLLYIFPKASYNSLLDFWPIPGESIAVPESVYTHTLCGDHHFRLTLLSLS